MKKMTKLTQIAMITLLFAIFFTGCKKDEPKTQQVNVTFKVTNVSTDGGLKSMNADTIICSNHSADYAKITIDGVEQIVGISNEANNVIYTNSLKMNEGVHILNEFTLWWDNNTPNTTDDDSVLMAAPHTGAAFSTYVTNPLNFNITISQFDKIEQPVEVLCYQPTNYQKFGFVYFHLDQVVVREVNIFGDICVKDPQEYEGSLYAQQTGGLLHDMPAICKVEVWRKNSLENGAWTAWILQETFDNSPFLAEGKPLKVNYGDYLSRTDSIDLRLNILVRKGTGFSYLNFYSWKFKDEQVIPQGTDGVVDFVLGNCVPSADYIIPPYMNLPATTTYKIVGAFAPGSLGGYVDAQLSNIPAGYELINGTYPSSCADHQTLINIGTPYNMDVYSSLYPEKLPTFAKSSKWEKINWLYNHLDYFPGYHWYDVQGFIWLYDTPAWNGQPESGMPALTALSQQMKTQADLYGVGYKVPTGGWANVIFIPTGTPANAPSAAIQTMLIQVDP